MKIELVNFNDYFHMPLKYGGKSCYKEFLYFNNKNWMIKLPTKNFENQKRHRNLSTYTSSVISEWLGSHIYEAIGLPVQKTMLGYLDGRLVVACQHICQDNERVQELLSLAKFLNDELFEYFSSGGRLSDINKFNLLLKNEQIFSNINLSEHFWNMFIVDAFIGNADRHPGNIGVIVQKDKDIGDALRCADVYDNGSSFNAKLPDRKIDNLIHKWKIVKKSVALDSESPYKLNNNMVLPLKYLLGNPCQECIQAIKRIVPRIQLAECIKPVMSLLESNLISRNRATFYTSVMSMRYKNRLRPAFEKYFGHLPKQNKTYNITPTFRM